MYLPNIQEPQFIFYVYAYFQEDGLPYYIGKGKNDRAWKKSKNEISQPPDDKSRIVLLERNLSEIGAFALERRMIRWYGRNDLGTGILDNQTAGGDGVSGRKDSIETKEKKSAYRKMIWQDPEYIDRQTAITKKRWENDEFREKVAISKSTDEYKQQIKQSLAIARSQPDYTRSSASDAMKEKWQDPEYRNKIENTKSSIEYIENIKIIRNTDEYREKMSIAAKKLWEDPEFSARLRTKIKCLYCEKIGSGAAMKRWHFDNCKFKKDQDPV